MRVFNHWCHTSITWTHWGRVTHICVSKQTIIGSDNSLSPGRCQAIIWTNDGILLIGTLRTNFSEILIECLSFSFKKMHMKMSSGKWRPSCLGLNVLKYFYFLHFPFHYRGFRLVGPFVVMIYRMMSTDLIRFYTIYLVFAIGFSQCKSV